MGQKIRLKSDFHDYYDHWLAGSHEKATVTFNRSSRGARNRLEDFAILKNAGFSLLEHGTPREVYRSLGLERNKVMAQFVSVVVHTDEYAHAGEGKVKLPILDAMKRYPKSFSTQYLPANAQELGISFRLLVIGRWRCILQYSSKNDWRSNVGEVEVKLLGYGKNGALDNIILPLYAIDLLALKNEMVAIDFNSAPRIKGTGIEQFLSAKDAANELQIGLDAMIKNHQIKSSKASEGVWLC